MAAGQQSSTAQHAHLPAGAPICGNLVARGQVLLQRNCHCVHDRQGRTRHTTSVMHALCKGVKNYGYACQVLASNTWRNGETNAVSHDLRQVLVLLLQCCVLLALCITIFGACEFAVHMQGTVSRKACQVLHKSRLHAHEGKLGIKVSAWQRFFSPCHTNISQTALLKRF